MDSLEEYGGGTAFEVRGPGEVPQPGEFIDVFEVSHNALVQSALRLHELPSVTSLDEFKRNAASAGRSITPFSIHSFFRESETPVPLQASVDKIADAAKELAVTTLTINPLWIAAERYTDMDREQMIEVLSGEDKDAASREAREICSSYNIAVANMREGVLRSSSVALFEEKQAKRDELQERLIALSLVAAGTFLGTLFAQRRRK
jgi:sugar phosphate isomerase/epimerase